MEYELEERPQADDSVWYSYSDRFASPQRQPARVETTRPDLLDRAIRIPDQEAGS